MKFRVCRPDNSVASLVSKQSRANWDWKRTQLTAEERIAEDVSEEILIEEGMH